MLLGMALAFWLAHLRTELAVGISQWRAGRQEGIHSSMVNGAAANYCITNHWLLNRAAFSLIVLTATLALVLYFHLNHTCLYSLYMFFIYLFREGFFSVILFKFSLAVAIILVTRNGSYSETELAVQGYLSSRAWNMDKAMGKAVCLCPGMACCSLLLL